jgi:peptide/nickel transport system substrate-binding protein
MDNVACRRAVGQAIDRRAVQKALGGADDAVRSSQLWPRGVTGGPSDADPGADLAGARRSLAACGQPKGFSTVLAVSDTPASVQLARTVAGQLAKVGIKAEVRALNPSSFYATDIGDPGNVSKNGFGVVLASWTADFPTAGSFLAPLVDGRIARQVGNTDYAHVNDAAINALIDKARSGGGGASAWRAVSAAALKTSAYVPLAENRIQLVAGERLRNGVVMQAYSSYDLATAGVR